MHFFFLSSPGSDLPRKKENPFSFKYFLKNDAHTSHQRTGARPKVYPSTAATSTDNFHSVNEPSVYPRNPVELPDFVQDHLVIEQCYLNHDASSQPIVEMENLPDFALNSVEKRNKQWNDQKKSQTETLGDLYLDLRGGLNRGERGERGERAERAERGQREQAVTNLARPRALNLPNLERHNGDPTSWSGPVGTIFSSNLSIPHFVTYNPNCDLTVSGFPFDLQLPSAEGNANNGNEAIRSGSQTGEAEVTKSLPDFLSDGPIHNRTGLPVVESCHNSGSPEQNYQRVLVLLLI